MITATEQPGSSSKNGTAQETSGANKDSLSYQAVYDKPKEAAYWIPDTPIEAEIVGVLYMIDKARNVTYVIQMRHGRFEWTITKRAKDFAKLRRALIAHRVKGRFKHPWRRTREAIEDAMRKAARAVGVEDSDGEPEEHTGGKSAAVEAERRLQEWMNMVLSSPKRRSYRETAEFFEVSRLSFIDQLGSKLKEGSVTKQPGGWKVYIRLKQLIQWLLPHRDRWLVLKDSYLCVLHPTSGQLKQVLLFDESFSIEVTGETTFKISNFQYEWSIRCHHPEDVTSWKLAIEDALQAQAGQVWKQGHSNGSSYPTRGNSYCQWLVDGRDYFEKLCVMLEIAREEIFIGAWWLCPVIYLRRPLTDGNHWRLDEILKRKAQEGVRIFVLLQKEMEFLIDQKSLYFKQLLHGLHENIRVLRHPDHYPDTGIFFWTHHEKMVVIDQLIAFVGGIDISYGRWDDATHPMTDLGSIVDVPKEAIKSAEPQNARPSPSAEPKSDSKAVAPKGTHSASSSRGSGTGVQHASRPRQLIQKLSARIGAARSKRHRSQLVDTDGERDYATRYRQVMDSFNEKLDLQGKGKMFPGKDYANILVNDFADVDHPFTDLINRFETPRMPWHDVQCVVYGDAARDLARHFIQRWNATKTEKKRDDDTFPFLVPKTYDGLRVPDAFLDDNTHAVDVQVLRSATKWSLLTDKTEDSIQQAYVSLIKNAQHYVYIENETFISTIGCPEVWNKVCEALHERITRAHRNNETFRVFLVLPILPGFEGGIDPDSYNAHLAVLHWQMTSLFKGPHSLIQSLKNDGLDPWKYVSVTGLRTHGELLGKLVTTEVYVHSKVVIVDDRQALISSANINDRSLIGERDSEICVLVSDTEFLSSTMNGQPYEAGRFAFSMRKHLMEEFLGLLGNDGHHSQDIEIHDPVADSFFKDTWNAIADRNTRIFEEVFHCYPTNLITSFDELRAWTGVPSIAETNPDLARGKLRDLVGTLVQVSAEFLSKEDLSPPAFSKENIIPTIVFV